MLFYNVLCVCFLALLAPKIETNAELEPVSEKPEAIFADVIKNISRVNTELQDLINNYEQFKKTQSSQEKFDEKYEKEIHYLSYPKGSRGNSNRQYTGNKRVSTPTSIYQTKMIFMGDEADESSQPDNTSEAEKSSQSEINSEIENNSATEKNSQSEHSNEEVQSKEEPIRSIENTNKKKRQKIQKTTTKANIPKEPKFEPETEKQEYIDIHKSNNTNKEPEATIEQTFKEARNSEKEKQANYYSGSHSYSESEQVIEDEEGASKNKNRASDTDEGVNTTKVTAGLSLKSRTDIPKSGSRELSDTDEDLNKDVFKTNILRAAYGDACLKLVIRKCHKACKSVLTNSCRAIKCKSDLKEYFITKIKTECIVEFKAKEETEEALRRDGTLNKAGVSQNGYLSMACQSEKEMPFRRMKPGQTAEQVNILRDKYERACQRISRKKCRNACLKAKKATCEKFECQKRLKKNIQRNCKSNCKRAYSKSKFSSGSSGSGSDSDSDSDSGSDSDEGSDESSKSSNEDSGSKSKSKS